MANKYIQTTDVENPENLPDTTGNGGKILARNVGNTGWEFVNQSGGGGSALANEQFSLDAGNAPPIANGAFKLDNDTHSTAEEMYISDSNSDGADVGFLFSRLETGDTLYIQQSNSGANSYVYEVSGDTTHELGYTSIPITIKEENGSIAQGTACLVVSLFSSGDGGSLDDSPSNDLMAHTGILEGGLLSINADTTKFDVSDGYGWIIDHSDPLNPSSIYVEWPEYTAVSVPAIGSSSSTAIAIDTSGSIVQFPNNVVSDTDYRDYITLGTIVHADFTNVDETFSTPSAPANNGIQSFWDFVRRVIGPANASGNVFSANGTNLSLDKSSGSSFSIGSSFHSNPQAPDISADASITLADFRRVYRGSTPGVIISDVGSYTVINPEQFDPNGDGTLVSMGTNNWQMLVIYYTPNNSSVFVAYGQDEYNSSTTILEAFNNGTIAYEERPQLKALLLRGYLFVKKGATDLTDNTSAIFVEAPAFRIKGSGGTASGGVTSGPDIITPPQITSDQNNYSPAGFDTATHVRLDSDASRTITGLDASASAEKVLVNIGANDIVLANEDVGSAAANRFKIAGGSDFTITADESATIFYDSVSSIWRII